MSPRGTSGPFGSSSINERQYCEPSGGRSGNTENTEVVEPDAAPVARPLRLRGWRRVALALLAAFFAVLAGRVLYGAYGYQPPEAGRGYRSPYLQEVQ